MRKFFSSILLSLCMLSLLTPIHSSISASPDLLENYWNTKTPMNHARHGLGVIAVDGLIYAIGGYSTEGYVATNERYDPATDNWVTLKPMPTPRMNFGIAAYDGNPY